jgi:hypothetical protein
MIDILKILGESEIDKILEYGYLNGSFFGGYI